MHAVPLVRENGDFSACPHSRDSLLPEHSIYSPGHMMGTSQEGSPPRVYTRRELLALKPPGLYKGILEDLYVRPCYTYFHCGTKHDLLIMQTCTLETRECVLCGGRCCVCRVYERYCRRAGWLPQRRVWRIASQLSVRPCAFFRPMSQTRLCGVLSDRSSV